MSNLSYRKKSIRLIIVFISIFLLSNPCEAGVASKAVREAWEYLARTAAREIAEEGGQALLKRKFKTIVSKYGDEVIPVIKKVGPRGINIIEKYGNTALKSMGKYGDEAFLVLRRNAGEVVPLVKRYGDDVMEACIKHPGVGKNLVAEFGEKGIMVARKTSSQQAIKFLRMKSQIKGAKKTTKILELVEKYGGKVIDHLDKHKSLYFIAAPAGFVLTKGGLDFLENPEKYFVAQAKGARTLLTGESYNPNASAGEKMMNNLTVMIFLLVLLLSPLLFFIYLRHKRHATKQKIKIPTNTTIKSDDTTTVYNKNGTGGTELGVKSPGIVLKQPL